MEPSLIDTCDIYVNTHLTDDTNTPHKRVIDTNILVAATPNRHEPYMEIAIKNIASHAVFTA